MIIDATFPLNTLNLTMSHRTRRCLQAARAPEYKKKTIGPDKISPHTLIKCAIEQASHIKQQFKNCMTGGILPDVGRERMMFQSVKKNNINLNQQIIG